MNDETRQTLSKKSKELILAYLDCYTEMVALNMDEGTREDICDFDHFFHNCQENWHLFYKAVTEEESLNVLLREYGFDPRF